MYLKKMLEEKEEVDVDDDGWEKKRIGRKKRKSWNDLDYVCVCVCVCNGSVWLCRLIVTDSYFSLCTYHIHVV